MGQSVDIGIAKASKWASRESGDTAELAERPRGGYSVVMVDGQGTGAAAKALSMMLTARAISLLKDGVRDGAVARAVHDHLLAYRGGKVSASLDIVSIDAECRSVVVTRNATTPFALVRGSADPEIVMPGEGPIGRYRFTRPSVWSFPFDGPIQVWSFTDGVTGAGGRHPERHLLLRDVVSAVCHSERPAVDRAADLLALAVQADQGRPADDMTVALVDIRASPVGDPVRRMSLRADVA